MTNGGFTPTTPGYAGFVLVFCLFSFFLMISKRLMTFWLQLKKGEKYYVEIKGPVVEWIMCWHDVEWKNKQTNKQECFSFAVINMLSFVDIKTSTQTQYRQFPPAVKRRCVCRICQEPLFHKTSNKNLSTGGLKREQRCVRVESDINKCACGRHRLLLVADW